MNKIKRIAAVLALTSTIGMPVAASAASGGKVLIVLSSEHALALRDGKTYQTGYFLNELAVPLGKIIAAGYTPVFADPQGNAPVMDKNSNDKTFFAGNDADREAALKLIDGQQDLKKPKKLADVAKKGAGDYVGIFIPGGHAPMQDLIKDKNLGKLLREFHQAGKPTGIICHGSAAILAALGNPAAFHKAAAAGDAGGAAKYVGNWPYQGYKVTAFSTEEEKQIEGAGKQLGGYMVVYAENALTLAGANVQNGAAWKSNVVEDRELVSGQQPFSDAALGDALVAKLKAYAN